MIKPRYKKGLDVSQLARSIVEYATGGPLTPRRKSKLLLPPVPHRKQQDERDTKGPKNNRIKKT
jgi:hypothetical protein